MRLFPLPLLLLASGALAEQLECQVLVVADGDILNCLTDERSQEQIRVRGVYAPERGQAFGERARQNLAALAQGKTATVHWEARDQWDRIIGAVWVTPPDCPTCGHTLDVGRAQLAVGLAWWFRRYAHEQPLEERFHYEFEESEAKARRIGLWRDNHPVPPWEWRKK